MIRTVAPSHAPSCKSPPKLGSTAHRALCCSDVLDAFDTAWSSVVRLQMRGSRLTDEQARRRANADLRPPRQIGTLVTNGIDVSSLVTRGDEVGLIGFKKNHVRVAEDEGTVRLTVKRKSGGDAPCVVFFSTSDGTARAGTDYVPQTGHLFFLRGQKTKEIKILVIDDDEASGLKTFYVTLSHPENCTVKSSKDKVKVTITDDDNLDVYRAVKQSHTYTAIEFFLIFYALFGNETVMLVLINVCQYQEELGNTPLPPTLMDDAVGTATLVLFFFFLTDMTLQFCIQGWDYVTGSTIRFTLDLLATILLLPSSIFIDDVTPPVKPSPALHAALSHCAPGLDSRCDRSSTTWQSSSRAVT